MVVRESIGKSADRSFDHSGVLPRADTDIDTGPHFGRNDIRARAAFHGTDIDRDSARGVVQSEQLLNLLRHFQYRAGTFLGVDARMRGSAPDGDRKAA